MEPLLIHGGRVIDPARGFDQTADVLLAEGTVAKIEPRPGRIDAPTDCRRLDAEGCLVAPGLIDIHVHFREPSGGAHEETIATGSAAAINGGFTSVCCMPNTTPPLDEPSLIRFVLDRAAEAGGPRLFPVACGTKGRLGAEPADIEALARAGAIAFSDDGDCIADPTVMAAVLRAAKGADRCFMQHCQDPVMTKGASMNAGPLAEELGLIGWPAEAEESIIQRDVDLDRDIGCRYHVQHVSSGGSAAIIRAARAAGLPVTGEASPHHLLLTEEACRTHGTNAKMNPPLRTAGDIAQLKEAVADGTITILATDHAPHPAARKATAFADAAFGIVGVDCALPLYVEALVEDGVIDWPSMLAMMTINPARLLELDRVWLGSLIEGGPADVTVIDPTVAWTIDVDEFVSTGRNCPFHGRSARGRAVATIVGGELKLLRTPQRLAR
jgi:dihydroorotase